MPTDFEWIRLPSDEWLKGKVLSMYNGKLEFDGDELGVHTWDFADIKRCARRGSCKVEVRNRPTATGRLILDGTNARVIAESSETTFTRAEILTIVVRGRQLPQEGRYPARPRPRLVVLARAWRSAWTASSGRVHVVRRQSSTSPPA